MASCSNTNLPSATASTKLNNALALSKYCRILYSRSWKLRLPLKDFFTFNGSTSMRKDQLICVINGKAFILKPAI